jgi:ATP-binding cassette subfamily B protein
MQRVSRMKKIKDELYGLWTTLVLMNNLDKRLVYLTLATSLLNAANPYILIVGNTALLNAMLNHQFSGAIQIAVTTYLTVIIVGVLAQLLQQAMTVNATRANEMLKIQMHEEWEKVDFATLETKQYYSIMNKGDASFRYSGGVQAFFYQLQTTVQNTLAIITGASLITWMVAYRITAVPHLLGITLVTLAVLLGLELFLSRLYQHLTGKNIKIFSQLMTLEKQMNYFLLQVVNTYSNIKAIKLWQMSDVIQTQYKAVWRKEKTQNQELIHIEYNSQIVSQLISSVAIVAVFTLVVFKMAIHILPISNINTLFAGVVQIAASVSALVAAWQHLARFQNQIQYVQKVLTSSQPPKQLTPIQYLPTAATNLVLQFDHVSFSYPNRGEVLHDVSFTLPFKGVTALVGENGSGKTTLVKLMLRLYTPTNGVIRLNGINIQQIPLAEYTRIFSVVFQDYEVFDIPVDQNIASDITIDQDKLTKIIQDWGLADWLDHLPHGVKTPIGGFSTENFQPSGGQQQQIAIARAAYRDGQFQILDEPTSSLDPIHELNVFAKIKRLSANKPSLFITHRIGATTLADQVIMLQAGRIVEIGPAKELSQHSAYFRQLWESQAAMYKD